MMTLVSLYSWPGDQRQYHWPALFCQSDSANECNAWSILQSMISSVKWNSEHNNSAMEIEVSRHFELLTKCRLAQKCRGLVQGIAIEYWMQ